MIGAALDRVIEHPHRCRRCGARWKHGRDKAGDEGAHRCPRCRRVEWVIDGGHGQETIAGLPARPALMGLAAAIAGIGVFLLFRGPRRG